MSPRSVGGHLRLAHSEGSGRPSWSADRLRASPRPDRQTRLGHCVPPKSDGCGSERRGPDDLGFGYRSSNLASDEIVAGACFALESSDAASVTATLAEMRAKRHEAQPRGSRRSARRSRTRTIARAEGRSAGLLLAEAGLNGFAVGGARFSPKHANFIENTGEARTADVLAVMAEGRRRVLERFGVQLEPEVQTLGEVVSLVVGVRAREVEDRGRWIARSSAAWESAASSASPPPPPSARADGAPPSSPSEPRSRARPAGGAARERRARAR